jgi:hypothetical protein
MPERAKVHGYPPPGDVAYCGFVPPGTAMMRAWAEGDPRWFELETCFDCIEAMMASDSNESDAR